MNQQCNDQFELLSVLQETQEKNIYATLCSFMPTKVRILNDIYNSAEFGGHDVSKNELFETHLPQGV